MFRYSFRILSCWRVCVGPLYRMYWLLNTIRAWCSHICKKASLLATSFVCGLIYILRSFHPTHTHTNPTSTIPLCMFLGHSIDKNPISFPRRINCSLLCLGSTTIYDHSREVDNGDRWFTIERKKSSKMWRALERVYANGMDVKKAFLSRWLCFTRCSLCQIHCRRANMLAWSTCRFTRERVNLSVQWRSIWIGVFDIFFASDKWFCLPFSLLGTAFHPFVCCTEY